MIRSGRYKANEWSEFEEFIKENGENSNIRKKCKHCDRAVSAKIERLRKHLWKCDMYKRRKEFVDSWNEEELNQSVASTSYTQPNTIVKIEPDCNMPDFFPASTTACKRSSSALSISTDTDTSTTNIDSFQTAKKTKASIQASSGRFAYEMTEAEKKLLDLQFARTFYACNIPFSVADNEHMKKFISMLGHGSYKNPSTEQLCTTLLDSVYDECKNTLTSSLKGQEVTLIQDGWSNIHNQPVIVTCLHDGTKPFFIRFVDVGAEKKTAEYCANIAEQVIHYCEETFGCNVVAFCSDSEAKIVLTRKKLQERFQCFSEIETNDTENKNGHLFVYGCAAHFLNLFEDEVTPRTVLIEVIEAQKYFANHHQPAGWLLEKKKGVKPQLPNSTRWNSQDACIDIFLKNYQLFLEIITEHEPEIDKNIVSIIKNAGIHMASMHLQKRLKKVSTALSAMKRDDCTFGEVVQVWMDLVNDPVLEPYKSMIKKRFDQCITPSSCCISSPSTIQRMQSH